MVGQPRLVHKGTPVTMAAEEEFLRLENLLRLEFS
jgi:hypothetical protein